MALPDNIWAGCCHHIIAGTPQYSPDSRQQQPLRERLGDIVVGPHAKTKRLVQLIIFTSQKNHRHLRMIADFLQQFDAIHTRHLDIQHRQINLPPG